MSYDDFQAPSFLDGNMQKLLAGGIWVSPALTNANCPTGKHLEPTTVSPATPAICQTSMYMKHGDWFEHDRGEFVA